MTQHATTLDGGSGGDAGSFYDRIAPLYDLTFKFNGYRRALNRYFREGHLLLTPEMSVLDAGCGTGLLTLTLLEHLPRPRLLAAIDLSHSSIIAARRATTTTAANKARKTSTGFTQADVLELPFADSAFDLVVTSGALEYVPLAEAFRELARVIKPGGHLLYLPIKPSLASRLLEVMFRFKTRPPQELDTHANRYFRIINDYRFPPLEPIGWTKTAVLAQKP